MKIKKTISLGEFKSKFTKKQHDQALEEIKYYDILTSFRKAREKKGLTQEKLAELANINRTTLSRVETGDRNATLETLLSLAKAMELNLTIKLQ